MSNALTLSESNARSLTHPLGRWRFANVVFWQVAFASAVAYISQLLIFDETNWYRIDLYDAATWGLIVTQIFALAVFVSRKRVQSVEYSLKIFLCMGGLSAGLTVAATAVLVVYAVRNGREFVPLLLIAPGYFIAVFVFLVSMFLQLRLAIICLQVLRPVFVRKRSTEAAESESITDGSHDDHVESKERYSIADILAFTGLAAASISAHRLVSGMITDYDSVRFLAMFYVASITAFCVYGLLKLNCSRWSKLLFILVVASSIGYVEFYVAARIGSPLLRFGLQGMLLCNYLIALATTIQLWFIDRWAQMADRPIERASTD